MDTINKNETFDNVQSQNDEDSQLQLMHSLNNQNYQSQRNLPEDDESEYDEFAEIKFDQDWMQKAWEILGTLWYHHESGGFLQPVSEDDLGEYYEEYMRIIPYAMDFGTMKAKMVEKEYRNFQEFRRDVEVVLKNCQMFNHE